jgi:hypothetical protein
MCERTRSHIQDSAQQFLGPLGGPSDVPGPAWAGCHKARALGLGLVQA